MADDIKIQDDIKKDLPPIPTAQPEAAEAEAITPEVFKTEAAAKAETAEPQAQRLTDEQIKAAVSSTFESIGGLLATATKIEGMKFNQTQLAALTGAWFPILKIYLPKINPLMIAAVVTAPIIADKWAVYEREKKAGGKDAKQ